MVILIKYEHIQSSTNYQHQNYKSKMHNHFTNPYKSTVCLAEDWQWYVLWDGVLWDRVGCNYYMTTEIRVSRFKRAAKHSTAVVDTKIIHNTNPCKSSNGSGKANTHLSFCFACTNPFPLYGFIRLKCTLPQGNNVACLCLCTETLHSIVANT